MIRRLFIVLALLASCGLVLAALWWCRARPPELPLPPLEDADPEIAQVIKKARDEVLRKPDSPTAIGALGMILLAHDYPDFATPYLEQASQLQPDEPTWLYLLALTRQADPQAVIDLLGRCADLSDRVNLVPRTVLGEVYLEQGRLNEAEEAFKRVTKRLPADHRARLGLARVALARGKLESALALLEMLEREPPPRKDVLHLLAQVHSLRKSPEAAEAARARAVALPDDPAWPDPIRSILAGVVVGKQSRLYQLASLQRAGRIDEANELGQDTARSHPELALIAEARSERASNNFAASESAYRKTIELSPSSSEARYELAELLRQQKKFAAAGTELRLLLERVPTHGPAWHALGLCAREQGNRAEALKALRSAVASMPSNAAAHRDLAVVLRESGDRQEALRQLRLAVYLDGKDTRARELLEEIEKGKKP